MKTIRMLSAVAFCAALSMMITASALAERWTVEKVNGGPNGYYKVVSETNDPLIGETTHTLRCTEPGNEHCDWSSVGTRRPYLIEYAETAISNGMLSGTYTRVVNGFTCTVTWEAVNPANATITEVQND